MKPSLLVLAAGIGSRYGGLKQLDAVGPHGETIIDYSVFDAVRAGFGKIVFVIREDISEIFRDTIGRRYADRIHVDYAFQELHKLPDDYILPPERQKPWGTGHAILMAKDIINEPFAVINSDDFYGADSFRILADFLSSSPASSPPVYSMVGFKLKNTLSEHGSVARGICTADNNSFLQSIVETLNIRQTDSIISDSGPLTGEETASMNMWGFYPSIFDHLQLRFGKFLKENLQNIKSEFFIPSVVSELINTGIASVRVLETESSWFGVTYKEDKPMVTESIQALVDNDVYPSPLWQ